MDKELKIIRNENSEGILQGFTYMTYTPVCILQHTDIVYFNEPRMYNGVTSVGCPTPNTQATAFESEQSCLDYIQQEGLIKEGTHEWHRQTLLRVFLNPYDNASMLKAYPISSNYADMTEVEADGVYVYLNFLEDEHRQIIEFFNGKVEP